ncbi:hypothetical protein MAR_028484, partial [Mya arenaria]
NIGFFLTMCILWILFLWGVVSFLGDFNAKYDFESLNPRDKFFNDTNVLPLNTLPLCTGALFTYVSYDDNYQTLIDFICMPIETVDMFTNCEIIDDHCLNVSRHRPVFAILHVPLNIGYDNCEHYEMGNTLNMRKIVEHYIIRYNDFISSDLELSYFEHCNMSISDIDNAYAILTSKLKDYSFQAIPEEICRTFETILEYRANSSARGHGGTAARVVLRRTSALQ